MVLLVHGKKMLVWCGDCGLFVLPSYSKKEGDVSKYDDYVCPHCGRLLVVVDK